MGEWWKASDADSVCVVVWCILGRWTVAVGGHPCVQHGLPLSQGVLPGAGMRGEVLAAGRTRACTPPPPTCSPPLSALPAPLLSSTPNLVKKRTTMGRQSTVSPWIALP